MCDYKKDDNGKMKMIDSQGKIYMLDEKGVIVVGKDFICKTKLNAIDGYKTSGTLELKGNFVQKNNEDGKGCFYPSSNGDFKVLLSGTSNQKIITNEPFLECFKDLELVYPKNISFSYGDNSDYEPEDSKIELKIGEIETNIADGILEGKPRLIFKSCTSVNFNGITIGFSCDLPNGKIEPGVTADIDQMTKGIFSQVFPEDQLNQAQKAVNNNTIWYNIKTDDILNQFTSAAGIEGVSDFITRVNSLYNSSIDKIASDFK